MRTLVATAVVLLCVAFGGTPALAQQSPSQTWNSSESFRSASDRQVDLQQATAQEQARTGGFGPGTATTNYNGTVNSTSNSTYDGPVSSTTAVNAVGWITSSSSITATGGSTATVTQESANQSGSAQQGAQATTATSGSGTNNVTGNNGNH